MHRIVISLVLLVGSALTARGEEHGRSADEFFREGARFQAAGERSWVAEVAADCFRKAIAQYRETVRLKPDHCQAQLGLAVCWQRLLRPATDIKEQTALAQAAREQFAVAAACPGADRQVYLAWGTFLLRDEYALAPEDGDRRRALQQARTLFEKGLGMATFSGERSELQASLATCLVLLGRLTAGREERIVLYQKAVDGFAAVAKVEGTANPAHVNNLWGVAQLEVARLTGSRWQMRQAIERLQASLEKDPTNLDTRYNVVCAYALIDDTDQALRQLRLLLSQDAKHQFLAMAARDPDLNSLRRTAGFNALVSAAAATPAAPTVTPAPPAIRER